MPNPYPSLGSHCLASPRAAEGGATGHPEVCQTCTSEIREVITKLPGDYDLLTEAIGTRPQPDQGPPPANKPTSSPPINLHIDATRTRLVYTAALWEEITRDHNHLPPRPTGTMREKQSLIQSVRILAPRIDMLATLPETDGYFDGPEYGMVRRNGMGGLRDLLRQHQQIQQTLGQTPITIQLPGICPCGAAQLTRQTGSDTVECAACQTRWTYTEYTAEVLLMLGELT